MSDTTYCGSKLVAIATIGHMTHDIYVVGIATIYLVIIYMFIITMIIIRCHSKHGYYSFVYDSALFCRVL